jgi:arabinose-5-phosphate isomerase
MTHVVSQLHRVSEPAIHRETDPQAVLASRAALSAQSLSWFNSAMAVDTKADWLAAAREVLEHEAEGIRSAASRLDGALVNAVELLLSRPGKVVITGLGKSGHVCRKIAATLSSTGTPAVFLHAGEAVHGDLGVYRDGDTTIMISKSGATAELIRLVPVLREMQVPLIGLLGNPTSPLAREMDVLLDASVRREADPHSIVPTTSSLVATALGDALAVALMKARDFKPEDFHRYHPGGALGRSLRLSAAEIMHRETAIACVRPQEKIKQVVVAMTQRPLGAACVVAADGTLAGLITDGDLRRALQKHDDIRILDAAQIMTTSPTTISPETPLHEALRLMEDRPSQISVLPVVDPLTRRCLGLVRIHDLYVVEPQRQ